jgi:hypothetical protein
MRNMAIKLRAFLVALAAVVVAAAVVGLSSTPARAGLKGEYPVFIKLLSGGTGYVSGSIASARATADEVGYLYVKVTGAPGQLSVFAQGRNTLGTIKSCSTTDPNIVQVAQTVSGDSYVVFYWDAEGNCTKMFVENGSDSPPKTL